MNRQDFQRNFSQSYFGLILTEEQVAHFAAQGVSANKYDLQIGSLVPCGSPSLHSDGKNMLVRAIMKFKDQEAAGAIKVYIKWHVDIDEDPLYMRCGVPVSGMIQGRHSVWYVTRRPARDTPRGYCPRYNSSLTVNSNVLKSAGVVNGDEWLQCYRVFNKIKHPWTKAIDLIEDGQYVGVVVDKSLALGVDGKSFKTQIYYKGQGSVGYVDDLRPYLYESSATYSLKEYIRKISGFMPEVVK